MTNFDCTSQPLTAPGQVAGAMTAGEIEHCQLHQRIDIARVSGACQQPHALVNAVLGE